MVHIKSFKILIVVLTFFALALVPAMASCERAPSPSKYICKPPISKSEVKTCTLNNGITTWTDRIVNGIQIFSPSGFHGCSVWERCYDPDGFGGQDAECVPISSHTQCSCRTHISLRVYPYRVHPGESVRVSGKVYPDVTCIDPRDPPVTIYVDNRYYSTVHTDENGHFSLTIRTDGLSVGSHYVIANSQIEGCTKGKATRVFKIVEETSQPPQPPQPCHACTVNVLSVDLRRVDGADPETFCIGDKIRVYATIKLRRSSCRVDPTVYVKLYVDDSLYETKTINMNYGETKTISFDDLITVEEGQHKVKVTANVDCDPTPSSKTKYYYGIDCGPTECFTQASLFVVPNEVVLGESVTFVGYVYSPEHPQTPGTVKIYVNGSLVDTITTQQNGWYSYTYTPTQEGNHVVKIVGKVNDCHQAEKEKSFNVLAPQPPEPTYELSLGELTVIPQKACQDESDDPVFTFTLPVTLTQAPSQQEVSIQWYVDSSLVDTSSLLFNPGETKYFTYQYYTNDLGYHVVQAKVTVDGITKVKFAYFKVVDCAPEQPIIIEVPTPQPCIVQPCITCIECEEPERPCDTNVDIGLISLNPEEPEYGDVVTVTAPVTLEYSSRQPSTVEVEAYIDGRLWKSFTLNFDYVGQTINTQFTFDTKKVGVGVHEITYKAYACDKCEKRSRPFSISGVEKVKVHCVNITRVELLQRPVAGSKVQMRVTIENCGDYYEYGLHVKVRDSQEVSYEQLVNLAPGQTRDVVLEVKVPTKKTLERLIVNAWNSLVSAKKDYEMTVLTGMPFIDAKEEYVVERGKNETISFILRNVGEVTDTIRLHIEGIPVNWMNITEPVVTLQPGEEREITVKVYVPRTIAEGSYKFKIVAIGSKAEVTSILKVVKPFEWPKLPTGMFSVVAWLPLVAAVLLTLLLVALLLTALAKNRRREETVTGKSYSFFDDCCQSFTKLKAKWSRWKEESF